MVETRYSDTNYNSAYHPADQVTNEHSSVMQKFGVRSAVKLDCPWKIWQPKDWSLLYFPMYLWKIETGRLFQVLLIMTWVH